MARAIGLIAVLLFISTKQVYSEDLSKYVKVRSLFLEGEKHILSNRDYYIPKGETPVNGLNLGLDLDISKHFYYDTKVVSRTNGNQFRHIGLHIETGYSIYNIDGYVRHFSGHTLDTQLPTRFPQYNVIGIRLNLIGSGRR